MSDNFNFDDLAPRETVVRILGKKYILREASEAAAIKYRNMSARSIVYKDGKVVGINDPGDVEPVLVAACLFQTEEDGSIKMSTSGKPVEVTRNIIESWPARIVQPLFLWVKKNSGLMDDEDTEEKVQEKIDELQKRLEELKAEKNSAVATTDTSV